MIRGDQMALFPGTVNRKTGFGPLSMRFSTGLGVKNAQSNAG
jgi:hypothetical protein